MSNDPALNSALFDFCNRLNDGPAAGTPSNLPDRTPEEMSWLRTALESFEAPDKILKTKLNVVSRCVPPSVCPTYVLPEEKKPAVATVAPSDSAADKKKPVKKILDLSAASATTLTTPTPSTVGQPGLSLIRQSEGPALLTAPRTASNPNLPAVVAPTASAVSAPTVAKSNNNKTVPPADNKATPAVPSSAVTITTPATTSADSQKQPAKPRGQPLTPYNENARCPVSEDDLLDSMDYLVEEMEDVNMALEACLMDMPRVLLGLLRITEYDFQPTPADGEGIEGNPALRSEEIRYNTAMALAHTVQQNPRAQMCFTALKWAEIAVPMLAKELVRFETAVAKHTSSSQTSRTTGAVTMRTIAALLHFCSCMCRDNDEGTTDFIVNGGLDILTYTLTTVPPTVEGVRTQVTTTKTVAGELLEKTRQSDMWDQSIRGSSKYVPVLYLLSPKVVKRVLFLVDYLATVGISNSPLIRALCDLAGMVMLNGSESEAEIASAEGGSSSPTTSVAGQEYLQMLLPPSTDSAHTRMVLSAFPSAFAVAAAGRNALRSQFQETVIQANGAAASPQFDDEVEAKLEAAADSFILTASLRIKYDVQSAICACLLALGARSQQVFSMMLKPRNVGKFTAQCYKDCPRAPGTSIDEENPQQKLSAALDA